MGVSETVVKRITLSVLLIGIVLVNPSSEEAERWKAIKMGGWRYENGSHYIGEWSQLGHKQGTGYLRFSDGSRYGGQFLDGLSHGLGCLWFADGSK